MSERKTDFYIRLESESDFQNVFSDFYCQDYIEQYDEEKEEIIDVPIGDPYLVTHTKNYAINIINVLYRNTIPIDGCHINIRLIGDEFREVVEQIDAVYGVEPITPNRVWL